MTRLGARNLWFQVHKWIGLILAILIIPISLTGSALVWHEPLEKLLNPGRYAVTGPARLEPVNYAAAAQRELAPGERLASLRIPDEAGEPVVASATQPRKGPPRGRPARTMIYLDPATGAVLERSASNGGILQTFHILHGSLMVPGIGRQIVGWIGVAMMLSAFTGLWIWWPTVGKWARGLRWRRHRNFDSNLHHQLGFWIALPLFVLSLTGAWISFPLFFGSLVGEGGGGRGPGGRGGPDRAAMMRAQPLPKPTLSIADAVDRASERAAGKVEEISWPTDLRAQWTVRVRVPDARPVSVSVDDATGEASIAAGPSGGPGGGRTGVGGLMRSVHDGQGMGIVWQVIIFVGGIVPAILAVTGIIMWWRARKWRGDLKARRNARAAAV